jgi:hypothetical protein
MRRHRKCQPHIHAGAIPVDSFTPAHLTFQAACGSLIRKFSQSAPPSELPCGSLPRRIPAPRFPSGFPGRLGAPACRYTARNQRTRQFHRTSAQFGLLSSRFAKPFGPACDSLSRRAQRLGSGSKCAATANASLTYIPELYRLIRSLPLISPCGLPRAVYRAASRAAWFYRLPLRAVRLYELEASPSVPALAREVRSLLHWTPSTPDETPCRPPATKLSAPSP